MKAEIRLCINTDDIAKAESEKARTIAAGLCYMGEVPESEYVYNSCLPEINDMSLPYIDEDGNIQFWHKPSSEWVAIKYDAEIWLELEKRFNSHKVRGLK